MKSNFFIRTILIPLIIFAVLGLAISFGILPKSLYFPIMIVFVLYFSIKNYQRKLRAEKSKQDTRHEAGKES